MNDDTDRYGPVITLQDEWQVRRCRDCSVTTPDVTIAVSDVESHDKWHTTQGHAA